MSMSAGPTTTGSTGAQIYVDYLNELATLAQRPEFARFHASMNEKVGYPVSPLRALELVMFLNAPIFSASTFRPVRRGASIFNHQPLNG